jgi:hypothetical protein
MTEGQIIYDESPQQCDLCGKIDELRPYGPNGECVIYKRDAIHVAVITMPTGHQLIRGQKVCLSGDRKTVVSAAGSKPLGIADPFYESEEIPAGDMAFPKN